MGWASFWVWGLLVLFGIVTQSGCVLLNWSAAFLSDEAPSNINEGAANPLGKIPTSRTAVTLEIVFVERPVDDPLLGSLLWDEVDQIGSLAPEDRQALSKIGFRVGRVGANPPRALQTLMGLATDVTNADDKRLIGRRVVLPSGAETEINTGLPQFQATINLPTTDGMQQKTLENVRGVFRMKAKRLQPGWARVEFLPEIHHGRMVNRPMAIAGGWQLQTSQAIERLYRQKFALDLNMGEMLIITGDVLPENCLGKHFFHSNMFTDANSQTTPNGVPLPNSGQNEEPISGSKPEIQRLLIIRLADLATAESLYSEQ